MIINILIAISLQIDNKLRFISIGNADIIYRK